MFVITNGALLTEIFLKRYEELGHLLVISLDTLDKEKWVEFRRRDHYDRVMRNILLARSILGDRLRIQSVLAKESKNDVDDVARFCRESDNPHVVQPYSERRPTVGLLARCLFHHTREEVHQAHVLYG